MEGIFRGMKSEFYFPSKDGNTEIHTIEWKPEGEVKAVLQMCHGMVEYIERYDEFAQYLCGQGIYVVGNDHLGHGKSIQSKSEYGFFHEKYGNACVLSDKTHRKSGVSCCAFNFCTQKDLSLSS